jgi:hypothetical protein
MGFKTPDFKVPDFDKPIEAFFEPKLTKIGLSKSQIEAQNLDELKISLETANNALQYPEQFGILKVEVSLERGQLIAVITRSNSEFTYEIGILPILLDRKRQILERISILEGEQKVASLRDLVKSIKDLNTRSNLEKELDGLEVNTKELSNKLENIRQQKEQQLLRVQLEHAEQIAKFAQSLRLQNPDSEELKKELLHIKDDLQKTTNQRDRYSLSVRFLIVTIFGLLGLYLTFAVPVLLSWTWFLQHPRKLGLQMSGILIIAGACWAILDKNQSRQSLTVGSIILATIVGIIQLL